MNIFVTRTAIAEKIPRNTWQAVPAGLTIRDLILFLSDRYDETLQQELMTEGELSEGVLILLNGESTYQLKEGISTLLKENDQVYFTVMVYGG